MPCRLELMQPILRPAEMESFKAMNLRGWSTKVIDATWPVSEGEGGLETALQRICDEASAAIEAGFQFIVLSDRAQGAQPFLLQGAATLFKVILFCGIWCLLLAFSWSSVSMKTPEDALLHLHGLPAWIQKEAYLSVTLPSFVAPVAGGLDACHGQA